MPHPPFVRGPLDDVVPQLPRPDLLGQGVTNVEHELLPLLVLGLHRHLRHLDGLRCYLRRQLIILAKRFRDERSAATAERDAVVLQLLRELGQDFVVV